MVIMKDNVSTVALSLASTQVTDTSYHTESSPLYWDTVSINIKLCLSSYIKYSLNSIYKERKRAIRVYISYIRGLVSTETK